MSYEYMHAQTLQKALGYLNSFKEKKFMHENLYITRIIQMTMFEQMINIEMNQRLTPPLLFLDNSKGNNINPIMKNIGKYNFLLQ